MKKTIAALIDELTVTNIKIYHLEEKSQKSKHTRGELKKLKDLKKYRLEIYNALNKSKAVKKSIATLIDELTITNLKIFYIVDKIRKNKHTREDAKKAQDLNMLRSEICNGLNRAFKERENIKI